MSGRRGGDLPIVSVYITLLQSRFFVLSWVYQVLEIVLSSANLVQVLGEAIAPFPPSPNYDPALIGVAVLWKTKGIPLVHLDQVFFQY